jgi:hypothetical protein
VKNADKLVPIEDDQTPVDPVQENQNILTGKPVKAFIEQDHQAHIAVHHGSDARPEDYADRGSEPDGATDTSNHDGAHQRARCVRISQTDRRAAWPAYAV